MLDGFLRRRLDRGLSVVETEEPETSEGVRVFPETSSFGKRDEVACGGALLEFGVFAET